MQRILCINHFNVISLFRIKHIFLYYFLFLVNSTYSQSFTERKLKSTIDEVTVFTKGGLISRTGTIDIPIGKSTLKLASLSPHIDDKSIQVKATGNFTVLSVNHKLNYINSLKNDEQIENIKNQIAALDFKIKTSESRLQILLEKQSLLDENKNLGSETSGVSLSHIKQAIDFYDRELTTIKTEEINTKLKIEKLNKQRDKLNQEISGIQSDRGLPTSEIEIRVDAKNKTRGDFKITYLVSNTGWFPKYDIRVATIEKPLKLKYKADIYQNTGVDWKNVNLKLSNGNPNQSGVAPSLNTWYLDFVKNSMVRSFERNKRRSHHKMAAKKVADLDELYMEDNEMAYSIAQKAEVMTAATIENQTTVAFELDKPYSIPSNNENLTVDLKSYDIETTYEYFAVPKLDKDAFLMARITNWDQYNLLEGEASLYFEDAYVGRSILDARSLEDTLNISLGRDKSILVGREKVSEFSKRKTIGINKVDKRGYMITVRNKKAIAIKLTLFDQIPLAATNAITVSPIKLSNATLKQKTGELKWELTLQPQKQKALELSYEVKYPKNEKVILD